jgi:hypothetical protein
MTRLRMAFLSTLVAVGIGPQPLAAQTEAEAIASNFGLAVDLCLQHVHDRDPVAAFQAAGFAVTPADEGTFNISTLGVTGFLAPLLPTEWCWIESDRLSLADVQRIGYERALYRYPQGGAAPATRDTLANGCPSTTIAVSGRITLLEFRNAGFFAGCNAPETGGLLFQ